MPQQPEKPKLAHVLLESISRFDRAFHVSAHCLMGKGLKPGQAFLLFLLTKSEGGMRMSELACRLHVTSSNVTQVVTDLEERGLLLRRPDPADGRAVVVALSEQGRVAVEEMRRPYNERMEELVRRLGEGRTRELIGLLDEVGEFYLEQAPVGRARADGAVRAKECQET